MNALVRENRWKGGIGLIDHFISAKLLDDAVTTTRARVLVISVFAATVVVLLTSIQDYFFGDYSRIFLSLSALVPLGLVLIALNVSAKLALCSHAFLSIVLVGLLTRTTLDAESSKAVLSLCTLGMMAGHLVSMRASVVWSSIGVVASCGNAIRLTMLDSPEYETAWGVVILTVALGIWSSVDARSREIARKLADEARERSLEDRNRLRVFAESAFPGIVEVKAGKIEYAGTGIEKMLGYKPDSLYLRSLDELVHPEDYSLIAETLRKNQKEVGHFEVRVRHEDGQWVWISTFSIPYSAPALSGDNQGEDGDRWIFAARDIEREQRNRRLGMQAERLEGMGLLAAGVAHDFNNLLTVVAGRAEMLPEGENRDYIVMAAEEATSLTSRLLTIGEAQARQLQNFDLREKVQDLMPILRSVLSEEIELSVEMTDTPCSLRADPTQINQIVLNLVTNARDAMSLNGRLHIKLSIENISAQDARQFGLDVGEICQLSIRDNGSGMDAETLERAFDPFFTTKQRERGSGLGLASAYRIARRSGGHLALDSVVGEGTTATLRMPLIEGEAKVAVTDIPKSSSSLVEGWVLVVEDEENIRSLIEDVFAEADIRCVCAEDGAKALEIYNNADTPPTLLVTDVIMPGMRGSVLAETLRLAQKDLMVLFISGYSDVALDRWHDSDDSVMFLAKPFKPTDLLRAVSRLIDLQQAA